MQEKLATWKKANPGKKPTQSHRDQWQTECYTNAANMRINQQKSRQATENAKRNGKY